MHHLVITAASGEYWSDCGPDDPHKRIAVHGRQALLIDCPETGGLHGGHVVLSWKEAGAYVTVSSHDHTDRNRRLVQEIAEGIVITAR